VAGERSDGQPDGMELAMHGRGGGRREPLRMKLTLRR
jgi:hypothetical protein